MGPITTRIAACLSLVACTIPTPTPEPPSNSPRQPQRGAPWTHLLPPGWDVSSYRTSPDPILIAGLLSVFVTNVEHDFDDTSPSFGHPGASETLGDAAEVVEITFVFTPPDRRIRWPRAGPSSVVDEASRWRRDRTNVGWWYRWREICRGDDTCVTVSEWHGPAASAGDVELGARVASSVVLRRHWTDPGW